VIFIGDNDSRAKWKDLARSWSRGARIMDVLEVRKSIDM